MLHVWRTLTFQNGQTNIYVHVLCLCHMFPGTPKITLRQQRDDHKTRADHWQMVTQHGSTRPRRTRSVYWTHLLVPSTLKPTQIPSGYKCMTPDSFTCRTSHLVPLTRPSLSAFFTSIIHLTPVHPFSYLLHSLPLSLSVFFFSSCCFIFIQRVWSFISIWGGRKFIPPTKCNLPLCLSLSLLVSPICILSFPQRFHRSFSHWFLCSHSILSLIVSRPILSTVP